MFRKIIDFSMWFVLFIFLFSTFGAGKDLYEQNPNLDIYNFTEKRFVWPGINSTLFNDNNHLNEIIRHTINYFGEISFQAARWGIEYGFNHPEKNHLLYARSMITFLMVVLVALAISSIFVGIYFLYSIVKEIREFIKKRKGEQ